MNPFLADVNILYPPEKTRNPKVFWSFQGVKKWEHWPEMDEEENFSKLPTKIYDLIFLTYNPKCLITTFAKKIYSNKLPLHFVKNHSNSYNIVFDCC